MKLEITLIKENPLMDRREVKADIEHTGEPTPSEEDVLSRITADKGLEKENVEINHVYTNYGSNKSEAYMHIYEEFEHDEELEHQTGSQETEETDSVTEEYKEIVSGTITEAKETLNEIEEPDFEEALKAEKKGKNRTTLVDWLENQI